jgi:glutamyl-tRNA synthetase
VTKEGVERALYTVRERARTWVEAADMLDYFFRDEPVMDDKAKAKFLVKDAAPRLRGFRDALAGAAGWTEAELEAAANAFLAASNLQIKDVAQSARVALTGRSASPGLYQVLHVLGREASLARLSRGAEVADAS